MMAPRMLSLLGLSGALVCWGYLAVTADELLPGPTGPHKIGRASFHWQDVAREELETKQPGDQRELMVHLFYPAHADASGPRSVYVPDAAEMRGPWDEATLARINAIVPACLENAPLPDGGARFPVLIFQPGGGMKGLIYHVFFEDLASHGWVVAAIDPPYNARAVRLPDGRVLGNLAPDERGWPRPKSPDEERRNYIARIAHMARDVRFVIDQLAELDRGDGPFGGRLDLARGVGVFGHSRGGHASSAARLLDQRIRGGVNIDGTAGEYVVLPIEGDDNVGQQPLLWMQNSPPPPPSDQQLAQVGLTRAQFDDQIARVEANWERGLGAIQFGAQRVVIDKPGVEHIDFSDEPFWNGAMTADSRPGKLETIAETRRWLRAFFEGAVRDDWSQLKQLAAAAKPPVTVHAFGPLRP